MPIAQLTTQPIITFDHREERVVFLGTPQIAVPTLEALAATALRPIAVITEPDKPVGRKQELTPPAVKEAAQRLGIPVAQPTNAAELLTVIQSLHPTIGVVVAYGRILKPELLTVPSHGFVNLHFSLLPKYRGATPIQAAILAGDAKTGVTLMQIDEGLDTGAILATAPEAIEPSDTAASLGTRLAAQAASLGATELPAYLTGMLTPVPQPHSDDSVTKKLTKEHGQIDWSQSPVRLDRFIRAMDPWPRAWSELAGERVIIHATHLEGDTLVLDKLQVAGSHVISASEFTRGYPKLVQALREGNPQLQIS